MSHLFHSVTSKLIYYYYSMFITSSFFIYLHKLFSMQLGPSTISCAKLIVSFVLFSNNMFYIYMLITPQSSIYLLTTETYCIKSLTCVLLVCWNIKGYTRSSLLFHILKLVATKLIQNCHKLHLVISPPILRRFSQSQWLWKALEKTFLSVPVTPRSNQYWPRYQADQLVTTMVPFIKLPISQKPPQSKLRFQAHQKPSSYRSE